MTNIDEARLASAFHEAGHVWAYRRSGLPVDGVHLTPNDPGHSGIVTVTKRAIDVWVGAFIAAAGPVAEAAHDWRASDDHGGLEWDDFLTGAVLVGGKGDLPQAMGLLDLQEYVTSMRDSMLADWEPISHLALNLADAGSITGAEAFAALGGAWQPTEQRGQIAHNEEGSGT